VRNRKKQRISFPLRLAKSLRDRARLLATEEGVSLNHFISLAVVEKVCRLEAATGGKTTPSIEREIDELLPAETKKDLKVSNLAPEG
jgi:hypothetical protein